MSVRIILGLALVVSPVASLSAQDVYRPELDPKLIASTFGPEWYGLYLQGKKIGYFHSSRHQADDLVKDGFAMTMKLTSFGQKSEMNIGQTLWFQAKAPYRLVKADFIQNDGQTKQIIELKAAGEGLEIITVTNGVPRKKAIKALDYNLADAMASEVWLRREPKLNAQIASHDLDLQELKLDRQNIKLVAIKNSLVNGVNVRFYEVEAQSERHKLKILSRHDDQGRMLSGTFAGLFELRRETEEQAKNTEFSQDLFVMGMAKINRPLGPTKKIQSLIVEADAKTIEGFEEGPRQSLAEGQNGKRLIRLGKQFGKPAKATAKDIEENLEETSAYAINDPKVKELAAKSVGDAKTPEEKVKRIVGFVHDFVQPNLMATLPNIHDLLEKKRGDCKSYALLTTTLCRAAGVPSREVSGLLYMGDDAKAFGGHAWNEVVLNGVWVPVDASLRQTEVDAGHICLGNDSRAAGNLLTTLGRLSFRLVEVETGK